MNESMLTIAPKHRDDARQSNDFWPGPDDGRNLKLPIQKSLPQKYLVALDRTLHWPRP